MISVFCRGQYIKETYNVIDRDYFPTRQGNISHERQLFFLLTLSLNSLQKELYQSPIPRHLKLDSVVHNCMSPFLVADNVNLFAVDLLPNRKLTVETPVALLHLVEYHPRLSQAA